MENSTLRNKIIQKGLRNHKRHLKGVTRKKKKHQINKRDARIFHFQIRKQTEIYLSRKEAFFTKFGNFITPGSGSLIIEIPEQFCLCTNFAKSFNIIKEFASSMYDYVGFELTLDFSKCKKADTSALFLLQVIRLELKAIISKLQSRFPLLTLGTEEKLTASKDPDVIRLLLMTGFPIDLEKFIKENDQEINMHPIDDIGLFKGNSKQQSILENRKPVVMKRVVKYLNVCLDRYGYQLKEEDGNSVEGIIGEVLSNAEDHSNSDHWYVTANFSADMREGANFMVGELNINIMNFGLSFYEAFEKTKTVNHQHYEKVESLVTGNRTRHPKMKFNNEQLFTLIMMSDQVSRLKYREDSRGTGTIKFLNAFIEIGDFEDIRCGYQPILSLITGNTQLLCDNQLKPFLKDTVYCLSLNPENDLTLPPRDSHLKVLNDKFPGTLLSVKIYLNKQHLDKKYGGTHHEN